MGPSKLPAWLDTFIRVSDPLTRMFVAIAITLGFVRLAMLGEVSGDSFTNIMFLIAGALFGKLEANAAVRRATDSAPVPPSAPVTNGEPKP